MEEAAEDQWVAEALKSDEMSAEMLMLLFRHSKDELRISKASEAEMEIAVKWVVRKKRSRIGGEEYRLEWSKRSRAAASCEVVVVGGDGNISSPTTPLDWIPSSSQSQEAGNDSSSQRNRKQTPPSPALMLPVDSQPKGHVGVLNKGGSTSCSRLNSNKKKKSSDEWRVEFGLQMKERDKLGKEREKMIKILAEEKRKNGLLKKLLEEMSSVKPLLPNDGDIAAASPAGIAHPRLPPDYDQGNSVRVLVDHVQELAAKEQIIKDQLVAVACSNCDHPSTCRSSPNAGHNSALQVQTSDNIAVNYYESCRCGGGALPDLNLPLEEALYVEFFS